MHKSFAAHNLPVTKGDDSAKLQTMYTTDVSFRLLAFSLMASAASLGACSSDDDEPSGSGGASSGGAGTGGAATGGAGSGGDASGTGGGTGSAQFPTDTSAEGIAAFLATESYKTWTAEPAPHPTEEGTGFHGGDMTLTMRAFFNDIAASTHEDAAFQAMTVKEMYDASGAQVGIAAALKTTESRWSFYCTEEPAGTRCEGEIPAAYPIYQENADLLQGCGRCHGDFIVTPLP